MSQVVGQLLGESLCRVRRLQVGGAMFLDWRSLTVLVWMALAFSHPGRVPSAPDSGTLLMLSHKGQSLNLVILFC